MNSVLVVDDNSMMCEFLKNLLSKDYEVTTCSSANEALEVIEGDNPPHLILLDYLLDMGNCINFLQYLSTSEFYKHIPVLILSGKQKSEIRINCLEAGAKDFLTKPFNPIELQLRIKNLINL